MFTFIAGESWWTKYCYGFRRHISTSKKRDTQENSYPEHVNPLSQSGYHDSTHSIPLNHSRVNKIRKGDRPRGEKVGRIVGPPFTQRKPADLHWSRREKGTARQKRRIEGVVHSVGERFRLMLVMLQRKS